MRKEKLYPVAGIIVILVIWQAASFAGLFGEEFSAAFAPSAALKETVQLLLSWRSYAQIGRSLLRVLVGLFFAFVIGLPAGILVGYFKVIDRLTSASIQFLRMISPLSWMPVAIIFLGVGDNPVFFLVAVAAVWPVIINTAHGMDDVPGDWVKIARNFGASDFNIIKKVHFPAIVPQILTGLRVALGVAWIVLVPAEMLGVTSGLGYMVLDSRDRFAYTELIGWILIIGLIGFLLDSVIKYFKDKCAYENNG